MVSFYEFKQYQSENFQDILSLIRADPAWEFLINSEEKINNYSVLLQNSFTFLCYSEENLCGYIRAILDCGIALYISELFVKIEYRNRNIGQRLIELVKDNYKDYSVYALSDEDEYYEKKGTEK